MQYAHSSLESGGMLEINRDPEKDLRDVDLHTFRYSTNLAKKAVKCSALLILPGIASLRISSGRIGLDNH